MEIRFAKPGDVPGILALLRQIGQLHHEGRPDLFRPGAQKYSASGVLSLMASGRTPVLVAVEDRKVLGYCFCRLEKFDHDPVMADRVTLFIDDLCVEQGSRGTHIGTALYQEVQQYARGMQCAAITLNVWSFNTGAIEFYRSLGFRIQKLGMEAPLEEG